MILNSDIVYLMILKSSSPVKEILNDYGKKGWPFDEIYNTLVYMENTMAYSRGEAQIILNQNIEVLRKHVI